MFKRLVVTGLLALSASLAACQQQPDRQESAAMVQEVAVGPILMYTERLAAAGADRHQLSGRPCDAR